MPQHLPDLPLIDRLKVQAELLVPLVQELVAELGRERAHALVRRAAGSHFRALAREAVAQADGDPFVALSTLTRGVRAGVDVDAAVRPSSDGFEMDVTRCDYARLFHDLGEPELGFLLVCSADLDMGEELPGLTLERTTTIMQGAARCDFRYRAG